MAVPTKARSARRLWHPARFFRFFADLIALHQRALTALAVIIILAGVVGVVLPLLLAR